MSARYKPLLLAVCCVFGTVMPTHAASVDPALLNVPQESNRQQFTPLSAVFDESLVNSPRAANIRAQLGISRAAYAQALTLPNPSIFVLNDTAQLAKQVGAIVPIEPPWKLAFRLLLARSQVKQVDFEIQRNLWQLRSTVRRAYLDVVMAIESRQTYEDLRQLSEGLVSIAQKRFAADDVAAFDVNRAELAAFQAEADLLQSEKKLDQTKQRLSVIAGRDYKNSISVQHLPQFQLRAEVNELLPDFSKDLPTLDSLIADALKNRLDLKVVRQTLAVNQAGMRTALGNIVPNTQLSAGSSYSGNPPEGPATRGYFIAVTQELPVFNFQQGELARLKAQNIQIKREFESTKNVVTEEVISAYQQLSAARQRVAYFQEKILPTSEKVARMARRGYEVGQNDITATLAAQQANVQTKASYLEAVRSYQQSLTDLEQAIGHPL
ncbi:MAG: TolC family protein [Candidatus Obscuribacterales bacterium]|nr:TolC family protein [Candidatus Obscuribacterales bacterium]